MRPCEPCLVASVGQNSTLSLLYNLVQFSLYFSLNFLEATSRIQDCWQLSNQPWPCYLVLTGSSQPGTEGGWGRWPRVGSGWCQSKYTEFTYMCDVLRLISWKQRHWHIDFLWTSVITFSFKVRACIYKKMYVLIFPTKSSVFSIRRHYISTHAFAYVYTPLCLSDLTGWNSSLQHPPNFHIL